MKEKKREKEICMEREERDETILTFINLLLLVKKKKIFSFSFVDDLVGKVTVVILADTYVYILVVCTSKIRMCVYARARAIRRLRKHVRETNFRDSYRLLYAFAHRYVRTRERCVL